MTSTIAYGVIAFAVVLFGYTYFGYPAALWLLRRLRGRPLPVPPPAPEWPSVSISVPAYNEESQIRDLVKSLLALDYPRDRLQILIVSDASTDATDDIVREYASEGVELLRMSERGGKTKAENAASASLRGEIIVNTDASIRILPDALKNLVSVFVDPEVGSASGRDVSVNAGAATANVGESGYVGYEMGIREMETAVGGIVGLSGCFYAIRPELHRQPLPEFLSRDFAAALHTIEHGYRAVSVRDAVCLVPRGASLRKEYARKVRTITRGMETLWHKRALLNPLRHGVYSWMLVSHKLCRWALPWALLAAVVALGVLVPGRPIALALFVVGLVVLALAAVGWTMAGRRSVPKLFSIPAFLVAGNLAAVHALMRAVAGDRDSFWEPTRRDVIRSS